MDDNEVKLGGLEAGYDGRSCVILRQKGIFGPAFHLTYEAVVALLSMFPPLPGITRFNIKTLPPIIDEEVLEDLLHENEKSG